MNVSTHLSGCRPLHRENRAVYAHPPTVLIVASMASTGAGGKAHVEDSHSDLAGTVHNPPLRGKENSLDNTRGHRRDDPDKEPLRNPA